MPHSNRINSAFMKPLVALAVPGMYLIYKYNQLKRQHHETSRRRVTERELSHLNHKIDKLLSKLDEHDTETARSDDEECVVCLAAKATMQTYPCSHRVLCRKCFVKTIQVAVSQRCLPLRCVICRSRVLKLEQSLPLFETHQALALPVSPKPSNSKSSTGSSGKSLLSEKIKYKSANDSKTQSILTMSPVICKPDNNEKPKIASRRDQLRRSQPARQSSRSPENQKVNLKPTHNQTQSPAGRNQNENTRLVRKLQKCTTISHTCATNGTDSPYLHRLCPMTPEVHIRKQWVTAQV